MNPLRIVWTAVADVYDNLFPMIGMNLIWLLLSVPVVAISWAVLTSLFLALSMPTDAALPIALLMAVIAPNPASIGIHLYANHLGKDERADFDLFWSGLRAMWKRGTAIFGISLAGTILLIVNLHFYATNGSQILLYLSIIWVYIIIGWAMMLMFMNALLVEQESKSIRLIVRNALFLCLGNLPRSLVLLVILLLLSVLSLVVSLLVALVGGALIATIETRTVLAYLERYRERAAKSTP